MITILPSSVVKGWTESTMTQAPWVMNTRHGVKKKINHKRSSTLKPC